jgi:2-pyrone-4,6-dicarboxylate lactonase
VRAVRFNFLSRLVDAYPPEAHMPLAEKAAQLGWHFVVYFEAPDIERLAPFLSVLPGIVVVDHMGRPDVALGRSDRQWLRFIDLMERNPHVWSKVSCPERLSLSGPPSYDDVVPFAREVVERAPGRVLWGTDWPHPNMTTHMPDEGALVDIIPRIAPTAELQHKLLVDNPMRLYWPEEVGNVFA